MSQVFQYNVVNNNLWSFVTIGPIPGILKIYTRGTHEALLAESNWPGPDNSPTFFFISVNVFMALKGISF